MKIAVIGAGVTGVTTAYELLKDTHEVATATNKVRYAIHD